MSLQHLIEEQKKEALKLYTKGGATIQSLRGETTLHNDTETLLTTAITKGYELALEEVEREAQKGYDIHLQIENTYETYPKDWHAGNRNALSDILTHIAHLKETI